MAVAQEARAEAAAGEVALQVRGAHSDYGAAHFDYGARTCGGLRAGQRARHQTQTAEAVAAAVEMRDARDAATAARPLSAASGSPSSASAAKGAAATAAEQRAKRASQAVSHAESQAKSASQAAQDKVALTTRLNADTESLAAEEGRRRRSEAEREELQQKLWAAALEQDQAEARVRGPTADQQRVDDRPTALQVRLSLL